jgi:hypothetical protein
MLKWSGIRSGDLVIARDRVIGKELYRGSTRMIADRSKNRIFSLPAHI